MNKPTNQSKIGVMSVVHEGRIPFGKQTYFFEDMIKSVPHLENDIFFFSPLKWNIKSEIVSGYKFISNQWVMVDDSIPKVIYDRSFSTHEDQKPIIEACRSHLTQSGRTILNPFELTNLLNDKVKFHFFLLEKDIPTLRTYPIELLKNEHFLDKMDGKRYYIKPTFGSKGQGIYVVEYDSGIYKLFDSLGKPSLYSSHNAFYDQLKNSMGHDHYFIQEEAKTEDFNGAPFDIRVLVQNYGLDYRVTGKAIRVGQKNAVASNLNAGGKAFPFHELETFFKTKYNFEIKELEYKIDSICLTCAEKLRQSFGDFCEIGFDILVTKENGPIIIEGNAKPSRWVFVKIADYLESIDRDNTYYLNRRNETVSVPMKYASFLIRNHNNR